MVRQPQRGASPHQQQQQQHQHQLGKPERRQHGEHGDRKQAEQSRRDGVAPEAGWEGRAAGPGAAGIARPLRRDTYYDPESDEEGPFPPPDLFSNLGSCGFHLGPAPAAPPRAGIVYEPPPRLLKSLPPSERFGQEVDGRTRAPDAAAPARLVPAPPTVSRYLAQRSPPPAVAPPRPAPPSCSRRAPRLPRLSADARGRPRLEDSSARPVSPSRPPRSPPAAPPLGLIHALAAAPSPGAHVSPPRLVTARPGPVSPPRLPVPALGPVSPLRDAVSPLRGPVSPPRHLAPSPPRAAPHPPSPPHSISPLRQPQALQAAAPQRPPAAEPAAGAPAALPSALPSALGPILSVLPGQPASAPAPAALATLPEPAGGSFAPYQRPAPAAGAGPPAPPPAPAVAPSAASPAPLPSPPPLRPQDPRARPSDPRARPRPARAPRQPKQPRRRRRSSPPSAPSRTPSGFRPAPPPQPPLSQPPAPQQPPQPPPQLPVAAGPSPFLLVRWSHCPGAVRDPRAILPHFHRFGGAELRLTTGQAQQVGPLKDTGFLAFRSAPRPARPARRPARRRRRSTPTRRGRAAGGGGAVPARGARGGRALLLERAPANGIAVLLQRYPELEARYRGPPPPRAPSARPGPRPGPAPALPATIPEFPSLHTGVAIKEERPPTPVSPPRLVSPPRASSRRPRVRRRSGQGGERGEASEGSGAGPSDAEGDSGPSPCRAPRPPPRQAATTEGAGPVRHRPAGRRARAAHAAPRRAAKQRARKQAPAPPQAEQRAPKRQRAEAGGAGPSEGAVEGPGGARRRTPSEDDALADRVLALLRDFEGVPLDTDAILMGLAGRGGAQKSAVRRALQLLVTEGVACTPVGKCGDLNTTYEARPGAERPPLAAPEAPPPRRRTCRPSAAAAAGRTPAGAAHLAGRRLAGRKARAGAGESGPLRCRAGTGPRGDFIEEAQEWEEPEGAPASNEPEEVESILDRSRPPAHAPAGPPRQPDAPSPRQGREPPDGKLFYKIKWLNCNHISWEPEENCEGCTELLAEFEEGYHACGGNLGPSPPPTAPLPRGFPAGVTV
eukprot:tig00000852_g5018.t1